jgi:hypothetical protein
MTDGPRRRQAARSFWVARQGTEGRGPTSRELPILTIRVFVGTVITV